MGSKISMLPSLTKINHRIQNWEVW